MAERQPEEHAVSDAVPPAQRAASDPSALGQQSWQVDRGEETTASSSSAAGPSGAAPPRMVRIVESLLFVGGEPLTAERACAVIRGLTAAQFGQALETLNQDYRRQGRPYLIQGQEQGYILTLRPRFQRVLDRLQGPVREARLSPAAIDVLSLVAYRQPATKQEIESIRGAESGSLLRLLVRRGLIAVVQRGEAAQREVAYGTTARFLELFGLGSLEDLPQTQDLQKL